jgi:bacteriocin biosynthesis cyclodehydratase domain-containing protein
VEGRRHKRARRGILSGMVLKVAAGIPLVWRSPSSLQFGVDAPLAVLEELDTGTERIVAALVSGISRSGFDMMARSAGLDAVAAEALLAKLKPVLGESPATVGSVAVTGSGSLADELRRMLDAGGLLVATEESSLDLVVIVAGWLVGARDHGTWLRRDISHVPVMVSDGGITVGPFVEPGSGPCLYCLQLAMMDDDPAWPAIATQLWSRPAPPLTLLAVAEAAAFTARRIRERLAAGPAGATPAEATSWRLAAANGELSSRAWTRHAACRCAAPAESDWAPAADRESPAATRRAEAVAVRA